MVAKQPIEVAVVAVVGAAAAIAVGVAVVAVVGAVDAVSFCEGDIYSPDAQPCASRGVVRLLLRKGDDLLCSTCSTFDLE